MPHTFINLDFETADPSGLKTIAGDEILAKSWIPGEVFQAEQPLDHSSATFRTATETFEVEWSANENFVFAFVGFPIDLDAAIFNAGPNSSLVEDFELGWGANSFVLSPLEVAVFGAGNVESFEAGWSANESFVFAFTGGELEAATLTPDGFETGWGNTGYLFAFTGGELSAASFTTSTGSSPVEDFEDVINSIWEITVLVGGLNTTGTWFIIVNGESAEVRASSWNTQQVRDTLLSRVNGLSVGVTATALSTDKILLSADDLPPDLEVEINITFQRDTDEFTKYDLRDIHWTQRGQLANL